LFVWNDFFAGSADTTPVFDAARVEFLSVLLDDDGAALDLLRFGSLLRLFRLPPVPGTFCGELRRPRTPPIRVVPPVADIFVYASLFYAECLCIFFPYLIL
jgi:hypothetical protein